MVLLPDENCRVSTFRVAITLLMVDRYAWDLFLAAVDGF